MVDGMRADGHRARGRPVRPRHPPSRAGARLPRGDRPPQRRQAGPRRTPRAGPAQANRCPRTRPRTLLDDGRRAIGSLRCGRCCSCSVSGEARRAACGGTTSTSKPDAADHPDRPARRRQAAELPTKTRRSNRTVPLPARCHYALAEHHRRLQEAQRRRTGEPWHPSGYVFGTAWGTPMEPRNLTRMWERLLQAPAESARCRSMGCAIRASACCSRSGCTPGS